MAGLFDKISKAAQHTAAAAQQTAAEGKIRLDIRNLNGRLDELAQTLGHLMFRQHKGETIAEEEYVKRLDEMAQVEADRKVKEDEIEELRRPSAAPADGPSQPAITCTCGTALASGTRFCPNCGRALA